MGSGASKKAGARPQTARRTSELGSVLSSAGITKVILIRHANAQPRDHEAATVEVGAVIKPGTPFANSWTVGDLIRPLTAKGEEQAKAAATAYLDSMDLRAIVCSEATRAIRTGEIMTHERFAKGAPGYLTLHTLHPSRSGPPDSEKMFEQLGYGTLNTFFADTSVPGCEGRGREIFRGYVAKVTGELHGLFAAGLGAGLGAGDTVAVFGHAVFLNAVAIAVGEAMSIDKAEELVAAMELGEAQGILCDSAASTIELKL